MATFTNGKYFHWAQRTAPATPYKKVYPVLPWTIANGAWVPKVKSPYQTPINVSGNLLTLRWTRPSTQTSPGYIPGTRGISNPWPKRGLGSISGTTQSGASYVRRRVLVFQQPPLPMVLVGSFFSSVVDGVYSIPGLQPGKYVVLDIDPAESGGDQALVYDQVVVS